MLNIARLFGKSPFFPLRNHMEKVSDCIKKLKEILDTIEDLSLQDIRSQSAKLSELEHSADITKTDIRNHLPKNIFLAIDRSVLLDILHMQDNISDKAEEIGRILSLKKLNDFEHFLAATKTFFDNNRNTFLNTYEIIAELNNLLETSFGGVEAQKVKAMIDRVAYKEYESTKMKYDLLRQLFEKESHLSPADFFQWVKLLESIGDLSSLCEKLANRIRVLLDLN